jgi:hypothetical protein
MTALVLPRRSLDRQHDDYASGTCRWLRARRIERGLGRSPRAPVEFGRRICALQIHRAAPEAGPPLQITSVSGEVRRPVDALALNIRFRGTGAKQKDIFPPPITAIIRDAVREGCHSLSGELRAALLTLPPELEYRFINRHLLLLDIHANVIHDFVPDAIPEVTSTAPEESGR